MINCENIITIFHCNFESNLENFKKNSEIYIAKDTHYLGDGMYFWDNEYDLGYWESEKKKEVLSKKIKENILSINAKIGYNSNELMNLCIKEEFDKLIKIKDMVNKAHNNKYNNLDNLPLGEVINKLFHTTHPVFAKYISDIKVMKMHLKYKKLSRDSYNAVFYSKKLHENQEFVCDVRTIYCIKNGAKIKFNKVLKKEVVS